MMKFYKGECYQITNTVEFFDGVYYEYIDPNDCDIKYLPVKYFHNTKEESLEAWSPFKLDDINIFHNLKFGKQSELNQIKKIYEETVELFRELEHYFEIPDNLDKIKDEVGDIIQASSGLFLLRDVMKNNFKKLAKRIYPDNFKHKDFKNEREDISMDFQEDIRNK